MADDSTRPPRQEDGSTPPEARSSLIRGGIRESARRPAIRTVPGAARIAGRPVGGWRATDDRGQVGVKESEVVAAPLRHRPGREPGPVQGRVEPVSRAVAREHPTRSVGAVGGGGEADYRQPRGGVAEAVQWPRPVLLSAIALGRVGGPLLAPPDQARAAPAGIDLRRQRLQQVLHSPLIARSMQDWSRIAIRSADENRGTGRSIALAAAVAAAAMLAGCGDGSGDGGSGGGGMSPPKRRPTPRSSTSPSARS